MTDFEWSRNISRLVQKKQKVWQLLGDLSTQKEFPIETVESSIVESILRPVYQRNEPSVATR